MRWAVGNAAGSAAGFVLGGWVGMHYAPKGIFVGSLILGYLMATVGAAVGCAAGGLIGTGARRGPGRVGTGVRWGRVAGGSLGAAVGPFVGLAAAALPKSLCFGDGPDGFWLLPLGGALGAAAGGLLGGNVAVSDAEPGAAADRGRM